MKYLSKEWKAAEWQAFEEEQIGGDTSDCGGQTMDNPPCGGCARCMRMQFGYYMMKEEERARTIEKAGLRAAPPTLIVIDWFPGFGGYHDGYNCRMQNERTEWFFPWEVRDGK